MKQVVTRNNFQEALARLASCDKLALDTETTGLRLWHEDRLFSIIIACSKEEAYYFNFQYYENISPDLVLPHLYIERLKQLFSDKSKLWFMHNAKFDMAAMYRETVEFQGTIHCTKAIGRVEYNEHFDYTLDASLKRIGMEKHGGPEKWIEENHAWEWATIPGKKQRKKIKFFHKVPFEIISVYGLDDATGTFALGESQIESIAKTSQKIQAQNPTASLVTAVLDNERRITKTVFGMEREGILIDPDYCKRALAHEEARAGKAAQEFLGATGKVYSASPKLFAECFLPERAKWEFTEKGNPSFESDVLKKFESPIAKSVLTLRDAKSRADFYNGFLYYADKNFRIHPNFNPDGAGHGRFSSSEPNFQNLTSENVQVCLSCKHEHEEILKECEKCGSKELARREWLVRQAIIPPPGYSIASIDYSAMEYRMMLEYACEQMGYMTPLAQAVRDGADVHQATADLASLKSGLKVARKHAKTSNFLSLYGGGNQKLADQLGIPLDQAVAIKSAILGASPEIGALIRAVTRAAEQRGYIRNWMGRMCYFPDARFAYRGTNYLIAGGCADVVKTAMPRIDEFLVPHKTRMVLNVHDELDFYYPPEEAHLIPQIQKIMEEAYPAKHLPLVCSAYTSKTSLADLEEFVA